MNHVKFVDHPDPNVVLRGGPLDGGRTRVHDWEKVTFEVDEGSFVYRPLGELDTQFPTLHVYVFDELESGESG
jgi:hypothetical protein